MKAGQRPATRRRRKIILWILLGVFLVLGLWAFWIEPSRLIVRETTLEIPNWPQTANPLRIVALADLHVGSPYNGLDKLQTIVAKTNAAKPDLIVLLGDYVIHSVLGGSFVEPKAIAEKLKALRAPLGVFAVLGNHDGWLGNARVANALRDAGIRVLDNDATKLEHGEETVWLAGFGDFWTGNPNVESVLRKDRKSVV